MESLTITEALSEINLIKKKVEKKQQTILGNLVRPAHVPDPLASQGGSKEFIKSEIQSMSDLNTRFVKLKGAIAKANITTLITVNGVTRSIHDWLIWKRDVSQQEIKFNTSIYSNVKSQLDQLQRAPQVYKDENEKTKLLVYESHVEYGEFLKKSEELQDIFDKLDGQLSLKNATVVVEV